VADDHRRRRDKSVVGDARPDAVVGQHQHSRMPLSREAHPPTSENVTIRIKLALQEDVMAAALPTVSLYATRWKPLLAALGFAGGVVVAVLWYFVWPTPMISAHGWEYQEPVKTVVFVVILVGSAAFTLLALYWVVTPLPLLQLTASSFTYRPFPLPKRVINWDDMEYISAFT